MAEGDAYFYQGNRFLLGRIGDSGACSGVPTGSYAIWDGSDPDPERLPVATFGPGDDGWARAWTHFSHWEPAARPWPEVATGWQQAEPAGAGTGWPAQAPTPWDSPAQSAWPAQAPTPWDSPAQSAWPAQPGWHMTAPGRPRQELSRSRRAKVLVAAGLSLVLVAGGAAFALRSTSHTTNPSGGLTSPNLRNTILAAYTQTTSEQTAQMTISGSLDIAGHGLSMAETLSGTGAVDFDADAISLSISMQPTGAGASNSDTATTITEIVDDQTAYLEMPTDLTGGSGSATWVSISPSDLSSLEGEAGGSGSASACDDSTESVLGGSDSATSDLGGSPVDPTSMLDELKLISDDVTDEGSSVVNGTTAEHYHATVNLITAVSQAAGASCAAQLQQTMASAGVTIPDMSVDVWIADDEILQETVDLAIQTSGTASGSSQLDTINEDFTVDFSGFGQPVSITPPPASEVESFTDYMNALQDETDSLGGGGTGSGSSGAGSPCQGWACLDGGSSNT